MTTPAPALTAVSSANAETHVRSCARADTSDDIGEFTEFSMTPAAPFADARPRSRLSPVRPAKREWSPENFGGEWVGADAAVVGATFRGRNRDAQNAWETIATVVEADAPRRFAFRVAPPGEVGTVWRYAFEPEGRGTAVTEAFEWYWTPLPDEGFRGRVGRMPIDEAAAAVARRRRHLQHQVEVTLARLKQALER